MSQGFIKLILEENLYRSIPKVQEMLGISTIFIAGKSANKMLKKEFFDYFNAKLFKFKMAYLTYI